MATLTLGNASATAIAAGDLFFPLRKILKIDGGRFSATVIDKLVDAGGSSCSYKEAARVVKKQAGITVTPMQIARLVQTIGEELLEEREDQARAHRYGKLAMPIDQPPVEIACVEVDGGRILTRAPDQGRGVHDEAWKESKVAALWKMTGPEFDHDPQPVPPECFRDPEHVRRLVKGLKSQRELHVTEPEGGEPIPSLSSPAPMPRLRREWPPERVYRTCVGTLNDVYGFGPLVAAEAQRRGFYGAGRQVFLGDGDPKNWTVHKLHFPHFTAITDFVHPVSYVYQAAGAVTNSFAAQWEQYDAWLTAVWQGRVTTVIADLKTWSARLGAPPKDAPDDDPRQIVAGTLTYLTNNASRMKYDEYRRHGLPITSCLVESLIKEFNRRVKGTEKFWNRPEGAEAILQIRAALLSDGEPLSRYILSRPGRLHYRRSTPSLPAPANRRRKKSET
jgi:hypothetical protein